MNLDLPTKELTYDFYNRQTRTVAKELLGKFLTHESTEGRTVGRIVETEAYLGKEDPACHSAKGLTLRNQAMFGTAGRIYVYQIYGIYFCFNITTDQPDIPAAVLLRALEPVEGMNLMMQRRGITKLKELCNGPAKLVEAMGITKGHNGRSIFTGSIRVYEGTLIDGERIEAGPRIGVSQAADWNLRFFIQNNQFISRKK